MSPKQKNPDDATDPVEHDKKKESSESTISQSSWIHKLTSAATAPLSPIPKVEKKKNPEEEPNKLSPENEPNEVPETPPEQTQPAHDKYQQSAGIWSWLGYSTDKLPDESTTTTTRPSYWKSFFVSSPQQDSVIISDDNQEEQPPPPTPEEQEKITQEKSIEDQPVLEEEETAASQKPPPMLRQPCKNNVVLPTFDSQFHIVDPTNPDTRPNLFSKAIHVINSIFTQRPHHKSSKYHDNHLLSNMIQAMKTDPEHVANKKILVIGVHGWFPMKLVRNVLGEPTGTSIKFCEQMTAAVKKYFQESHDLELPDKAIINIPLQWEGKVLERVEKLYEYLISDCKEAILSADVILWVTHSQGTPVSAILLKKLIEENIIQTEKQPVCMLAMAGISHGPFPFLKGNLLVKYFEADAARELFEFMDSDSDISIQYRESMAYILQSKVKTVLMGSMQDQVVPLYSAIMSGITHPNILRAVYIDGHIYSKDDFLIRLITFAIRLLNVGLSDHGFLIHISEVLAGKIYAWEGGHSTIYEELNVFMLPLQYLFETPPFGPYQIQTPKLLFKSQLHDATDRAKQKVLDKVKARLDPFQVKPRLNPFHLPWAMRGIWDDPRILDDEILSHELELLQDLFDKWNPTSAKLKEIKFRLEPLKARL